MDEEEALLRSEPKRPHDADGKDKAVKKAAEAATSSGLISSQCLYLAVAVIVLLLAWPLGAPDVHPQAHMQLALAAACVHARIVPHPS